MAVEGCVLFSLETFGEQGEKHFVVVEEQAMGREDQQFHDVDDVKEINIIMYEDSECNH